MTRNKTIARRRPGPKREKSKQRIIDAARRMPPLYHKNPDGGTFRIGASRVVWWLCHQPEVQTMLWDLVKQSGSIRYDAVSKKWVGVEFAPLDDDEEEDRDDDVEWPR